MKIAHFIQSLDPLDGGPPVVVARLAAELARQGHDVRIVSRPAPDARQRIDAMIGSLPGADKVQYQYLQSADPLSSPITAVQFVHLHGVWGPLLKKSASIADRIGIPYAVAPHGMLDPWSLSQKRWKKKLALLLGYRRMLNRSAFLHLLNADEKQLLAPLGLTCPGEVIANGISPEEFQDLPAPGSFRAAHPELGAHPYVLFLSRLHFKKGLDLLAQAFFHLAKQNPGVRLVVAGRDEGAEQQFRDLIHAAGLTGRVHLTGPVFGSEKIAAIIDAACFCLPSRQEGFSIAILEAMACGCPVVISSACHFPEVATAGAGVVVELNAQAVADALDRVLVDPSRARQMGQAGRHLVLTQYTWPAISRQLVGAYQRHLKML